MNRSVILKHLDSSEAIDWHPDFNYVNWGRAASDPMWFRMSFNEAAQNTDAIQFDVSSFNPAYSNPGMTSWEFNRVVSNPSLLGKTTFTQNGQQVILNGTAFAKP